MIWSFLSLPSTGIVGLEEVGFCVSREGPSRPGPTAHRSERGGSGQVGGGGTA